LTEIIWSGPAEKDLVKILEYYAIADEQLASRLVAEVLKESLRLPDFPKMGAPIGARGLRKWHVHGTPFLLLYGVRAGRIEIRRVRHVREDWRSE
jgi:plasmid stabilization system protein ParE